MTQSRRLKELHAEQAAEMHDLRLLFAETWQAASPRRVVESHPFISTGIAALLGLTIAPASRPAAESPSLIRRLAERLLSGPASTPAQPQTESQPPIQQWLQGIQTILLAIQTKAPASADGFNIIIADAGTVSSDSLAPKIPH